MRPTFLPAVLLLGAVACGDDPFAPDTAVGEYALRHVSGAQPPVLIPPEAPPFRYDVLGGDLVLDADQTFTLTLQVRITQFTPDGSRIIGILSEGRDVEVGSYEVIRQHGNQVWLSLRFSANRRFGLEQTVTISESQYTYFSGRGLHPPCLDYRLSLQRPGDPEYVFGWGCGPDHL